MLLIDYPSGLIALSIFLLIAVIALFSTVSNIQNDKENKHLHIENKMLKDKLAKHILERLGGHLSGYQHIDLSLKNHGFCSDINPTGWKVNFLNFPESELDEKEQYYIKKYADKGYQMRNKTLGGQGMGKYSMDNCKPPKNYYDGLHQGYKNAQKFAAHLFNKHLNYFPKSDKPNKNQEKAMQKFTEFLKGGNDE